MRKITLNFFGEKAEVVLPGDLKTLRKNISDQFLFSSADAEELVISYIKDYTKVLLKSDADLKALVQLKEVKELNLDVCESSKLYQEKKKTVEEEQQGLMLALNEAKKEESELINKSSQMMAKAQTEQIAIKEQMRLLKDQLIKNHLDLKVATKENRMRIKEKRTLIKDLEDKLNLPEDQRFNPVEEMKKMFSHEKRGCFKERKCCKAKYNKMEEMNPLQERKMNIFAKMTEAYKPECENPLEKEKEKVNEPIIHPRVECNGCGMNPIQGTRFKCAVCDNFDYCELCETINSTIHLHPFICIRNPKLSPTAIKCCIPDDMPVFHK